MSASTPRKNREFVIRISGEFCLEPKFFFDDAPVNEHKDATEIDCAREVSKYVAGEGIGHLLRDWNIDDVDIYVGNYPAVLKGIPITESSAAMSPLADEYPPPEDIERAGELAHERGWKDRGGHGIVSDTASYQLATRTGREEASPAKDRD